MGCIDFQTIEKNQKNIHFEQISGGCSSKLGECIEMFEGVCTPRKSAPALSPLVGGGGNFSQNFERGKFNQNYLKFVVFMHYFANLLKIWGQISNMGGGK